MMGVCEKKEEEKWKKPLKADIARNCVWDVRFEEWSCACPLKVI